MPLTTMPTTQDLQHGDMINVQHVPLTATAEKSTQRVGWWGVQSGAGELESWRDGELELERVDAFIGDWVLHGVWRRVRYVGPTADAAVHQGTRDAVSQTQRRPALREKH